MNGLWVVLPALFLWESVGVVMDTFQDNVIVKHKKKDDDADEATNVVSEGNSSPSSYSPSMFFYYLSAGCIVAYVVLVPAILSLAEPVPVQH